MTNKLHYNIKVKGKVQGVWFRDSTRNKALELGVTGFVRNEPDGSVYLEAEGGQEELEQLKTWCATGPPRANVEQVIATAGDFVGFGGFEIRR